jgi:phage-related protein
MDSGEVRDLALELSNVTFPLEDVLGLMTLGREQGLQSKEALEQYANFWDMIGDATGESSTQLAESAVALKAVGIEAGNENEALGAFGYITRETTSSMPEFLKFLEMTGPELRDMGMDVDDSAAVLGILEKEFGLTGRRGISEFRSAISNADGDMDAALKTLGISRDKLDEYKNKVSECSDVMGDYAKINNDTYTSMQKLQHWTSELTYKYGDLLGMIGNLSPLLIALGPMMKGVSVAQGLFAKVTWSSLIPAMKGAIVSAWNFTAALLANPITWIVIGIIALIAAIILLWKNWDKVSAFLIKSWNWIKDTALKVWGAITDFFTGIWDKVKEAFQAAWEWIKNMFLNYTPYGLIIKNWEQIVEWFSGLWDRVKEAFAKAGEAIFEWMRDWIPGFDMIVTHWDEIVAKLSEIWNAIKDFFIGIWEAIKGAFDTALNFIKNLVSKIFEGAKLVITTIWNSVRDFFIGIWENIKKVFGPPIEWIRTTIETVFNAVRDFIEPLWNGITEFFSGIWDSIMEKVNLFKEGFLEVWDGIKEGIKTAINGIIGFINGMIGAIETGLNFVVRALNKIKIKFPDWEVIPRALRGVEWGLKIPEIGLGRIPTLATGGIIERAGAVIVGERPELISLPRGAAVRPLPNETPRVELNFYMSDIKIRDDRDIKTLSEQLYRQIVTTLKAKGVLDVLY